MIPLIAPILTIPSDCMLINAIEGGGVVGVVVFELVFVDVDGVVEPVGVEVLDGAVEVEFVEVVFITGGKY